MSLHPTPVVTATIYFEDSFLVMRRHDAAKKYGGLWGFPGGKVELGETIIGALVREVAAETGLELNGDCWLLNSYYYGDSVGSHFAVVALSNIVTPERGVEYKWIKSL